MSNSLKEIKKLSIDKLQLRLEDCYDSISNMRFQKVLGDLEHPQKIKAVKKEIAQIKTLLREYELEGNKG